QRLLCAEIMHSYMHEFANLYPLDEWLTRLLRLLAEPEPFPSPAAELHARTACLFALDFRMPEPALLSACVARLQGLLDEDVPADLAVMATGILIMHLYVLADLSECARMGARLRKLYETDRVSPVGQALAYVQLGHATLRCGDSQEAKRLFNQALQF